MDRRKRLRPERANASGEWKIPRTVSSYDTHDFLPILLPQLDLLNVDPEHLVYGDSRDVGQGRTAVQPYLEGHSLLEPQCIPLENRAQFLVVHQCD